MKNFKSIGLLNIPCKRINVFIGPPNTGKSNILESIGVLSAAARVQRTHLSSFVRMQNMADWFPNKFPSEEIMIGFDGSSHLGEQGSLEIKFENGFYQFTLTYRGNQPQTSTYSATVDNTGLWRAQGPPMSPLGIFKFYRFEQHQRFSTEPSEYLEPPAGQNLLAVLQTNATLREAVAALCEEVGLTLSLKPAEGQIELQREYQKNVVVSFPIRFTSDSLQRTTFTLAAIYSNSNSVITLEEPEAHSFPYENKSLAETIGLDKRGNQYFIATHNPYFLTSLIEKTPRNEIQVGVTSLENSLTKVNLLNESQIASLFEAGASAFFNLDTLTKK